MNKDKTIVYMICDDKQIKMTRDVFDYLMTVKHYNKKLKEKIIKLQQENTTLIKNQINSNSEHFRIIKENKRKIDDLRKQNKELKSDIEVLERVKNFYKRHTLKYYRRCNKANVLIQRHNEDTGYIYYKYDNKFVRSELKERLSEVLNGDDENETNS